MRTRGAQGWVRTTPDRLAGLDEQRLVVAEPSKLADDRVEGRPAAGGAPGPAVDDEVVRVLGDLGIEVVHEHPQDRFLLPAAAGQLGAAGRPDGPGAVGRGSVVIHARSLLAETGHDLLAQAALADRGDGDEDVPVLRGRRDR